MTDDKKATTKPEPPTVPNVLAAHTAMFEALARLPEASRRDDRDEIHEAIGRGHRTLMEAASYREDAPEPPDARLMGLGQAARDAMDYTIGRIDQLPSLTESRAAACAAVTLAAEKAWGNLGYLLDMMAMPGEPPSDQRNAVRELAQECQQAYDGWRVQQPATEEPWSNDDEKRLALAFIPPDGEHGEPGK